MREEQELVFRLILADFVAADIPGVAHTQTWSIRRHLVAREMNMNEIRTYEFSGKRYHLDYDGDLHIDKIKDK